MPVEFSFRDSSASFELCDSTNNRFELFSILPQNIPTRTDAHTTSSWNVSVLKLTRDGKGLREDFEGDDVLD